jgi:acyl-CoA thioester hydrolase
MGTRITTPYEGIAFAGWESSAPIAAPLQLHTCQVKQEWTDYNDHLSESSYLLIFGDNSDALFRYFGIDESYREKGNSLFTVETHIRNLDEASTGDRLTCTVRIVAVDSKRIHTAHQMFKDGSDDPIATAEQMLLHVDLKSGKTAQFPDEIYDRLTAIQSAHASLPDYEWVGRSISLTQKGRA